MKHPDDAAFCPGCGGAVNRLENGSAFTPATSEVLVVPSARAFFNVGTPKLLLMSTSTFGLYVLYWLYKNWEVEQEESREAIMPAARAFFAAIFIYSLARRLKERALSLELQSTLQPGLIAVAFIGLALASRLPDPWWLISLLVGATLIPMQNEIVRINSTRGLGLGPEAKFSGLNIAWLVVAGLLWLLIVLGLLLPDVE